MKSGIEACNLKFFTTFCRVSWTLSLNKPNMENWGNWIQIYSWPWCETPSVSTCGQSGIWLCNLCSIGSILEVHKWRDNTKCGGVSINSYDCILFRSSYRCLQPIRVWSKLFHWTEIMCSEAMCQDSTIIASMELSDAVSPVSEHLIISYLSKLTMICEEMIPQGCFAKLSIDTVYMPQMHFVFASSILQFL